MFVCPECGWSKPSPGTCSDGNALVAAGDDVLLGMHVGPYRVARLLGVGGMGRVYKAVQPNIGSRVAIKVLSRECTDRPDLVERFFAEARAVNLIKHENIVNVLDHARLPDGRPYIVMEYLDGQPLASVLVQARMNGEQLPIGGVVRVVVEVLDAVGAAHQQGIIHRDLKPDNVFVTPSGRAKVLDFGIAKLQPELGGSGTQTGSLLGTPHYMSPEQAQGMAVDHRTDLYAIGVILYECLTLAKPFAAESLFALLRMQIETPPRPPREARPELSRELDTVVQTALAKLPDQRFPIAPAMVHALQHATAQLPSAQWAPLGGGVVSSWQGAPPSWVGRLTPPPAANIPTVTSGERAAQAPPSPGSRRGWFVLGGLALVVGGAVAIAIALSRNRREAGRRVERPARGRGLWTRRSRSARSRRWTRRRSRSARRHTSSRDRRSGGTPSPPAGAGSRRAQARLRAGAGSATAGSAAAGSGAPGKRRRSTRRQLTRPGITSGAFRAAAHRRRLGHPPRPEHAGLQPARRRRRRRRDVRDVGTAMIPDAKLVRVLAANVDRRGHADLSLASFASSTGSVDVRFLAPSLRPPDADKPKPFGFVWKCEFLVEADPDGVHIRGMDGIPCLEPVVPPPRCQPAAIWTGLHVKLPARSKRADLDYRRLPTGKPSWYFTIRGVAEDIVLDGCK